MLYPKSPGPGEHTGTQHCATFLQALCSGYLSLLLKTDKENVEESGLPTVRVELTKLRPFCLEKEGAESPWRPRWEGT